MRWTDSEGLPEPLRDSASKLVSRLGMVDGLASAAFTGSPHDVVRVNAMIGAMRKLDAAYVVYRQRVSRAAERDLAATALDAELLEVRGAFDIDA